MADPFDSVKALEEAALASVERGDWESGAALAAELLRRDPSNEVAREVVARTEVDSPGELRRLTILFCDLVGSTRMSARQDPEAYHRVLQRYHRLCEEVIVAAGGTVNQRVGDGVLAIFGHPRFHEDGTRRAVRAGLALADRVAAMRPSMEREFGESLEVRIAVHLGPVHLDLLDSAIYGLAPNIAARLQDLARPGTVVVTDEVLGVVGGFFEISTHEPHQVKGVDEPLRYHTIERELPHTRERGRSWLTAFVGRRDPRDQLRTAVEDGSPVLIRGEAGMGKSRLVDEVLSELGSGAGRVTTLLCTEYEQSSDFGVATGLLRLDSTAVATHGSARLAQLRGDLGALGLDPEVHTGLLAPLLGLEPTLGYERPATDLTRVHEQVLASLRAWLTALAAREPVILLVEDVQWADPSTAELVQGLVREPIDGVQLVATERSGSQRLTGGSLVVIELAPLGDDEAVALAIAVDRTIGGERLTTTLSRAQGNPLFIEELAREPAASAPVDPHLLTRLTNESVVPGVLYEPLLTRLYNSGADVGLAQAAATIGRSFTRPVLAAVVARPPDVLDRGIRSLLDTGLIEADDETYWFRHALIRDVAYDLQPREQRVAMHRRVGVAMRAQREEGADISWSVIATHFHASGSVDEAIDAYAAAADDSRQKGSMQAGVFHLTTAIDLIVEHGGGDRASRLREVDLRLKRGFLCVSSGGNADPRAVADYERCLELVRAEDSGPELVGTLVALWGYHTARGDLSRADALLDDIMNTGVTDDPVMLAENRTARGMVRFFQGDFVASEELLRLALEGTPEAVPDTRPLSPWEFPNDPVTFLHLQFGLALWQRGDLKGFHDSVARARARASGLPGLHGPFNTAYVLTHAAWVLTEIGDHAAAAASVEELLDISGRYGFDFWTLAGNSADAIRIGRASLASSVDADVLREQADRLAGTAAMTEMIDARLLLPYGMTAQGEFRARADDHAAAVALFDAAMAMADATGSQFYRAETHRLRARSRQALGEVSADDDLHAAIELAERQGSIPFELRARVDLARSGQRSDRLDELLAEPASVAAAGLDEVDLPSPTG
jgi:class 3 adenylate cyclase